MALFPVLFAFLLLLIPHTIHSAPASLRICHTNDFHAKYLPVGASNVKCKWLDMVRDRCHSGIARLSYALDMSRCDVRVQAGDWVQGSLLDTVFQQQIAIEAYHWTRYDIAVFGNHEFDFGLAHINDTIRAIAPHTKFLSTNVFFDDIESMQDLPLYRYLDLHDICWVSLLTTATYTMSIVPDGVKIENELKHLRRAMRKCEQDDRVIAVTHQGFKEDVDLCKRVKELDIVIGGHTHTNLNDGAYPHVVTRRDGSTCYVVQAYAHGRVLGVLDIEFDNDGTVHIPGSQYLTLDARVPEDPIIDKKMALFNDQVEKKAAVVVGSVTEDIAGGIACDGPAELPDDGTPVRGDCTMAALVCDAMLAYFGTSTTDTNGRERVCLLNGGGLRTSFTKGDVKVRDVVNVLPFGNSIASVPVTGKDIRAALTHGLSSFNIGRRGYPGSFGNMHVNMYVDENLESREAVAIGDIHIAGELLVDDREYVMVTSSYVAGGGSGYSWPEDEEVTDYGTLLREALQKYLAAHNPYTPEKQARTSIYGVSAKAQMKKTTEDGKRISENHVDVMDENENVESELDDRIVDDVVEACESGVCDVKGST